MSCNRTIRIDRPASNWNEAFPLGNGRLGAMLHGGIVTEHLQLNDDTLWSGGKRTRRAFEPLQALGEIRSLLRARRVREAEELALKSLRARPENQRHFEPLADLFVASDTGGILRVPASHQRTAEDVPADYRRELDLERGVASVRFTVGEVSYRRQCFVSAPDSVLVLSLSTGGPSGTNLIARLRRLGAFTPGGRITTGSHFVESIGPVGDEVIMVSGSCGGEDGIHFRCGLSWIVDGGTRSVAGDLLEVHGAKRAVLLVASSTSYRAGNAAEAQEEVLELLRAARAGGYQALYERHVEDYSTLFDRCRITIEDGSAVPDMDTPARIEAVRNGTIDTALETLYFDFGRYLLISSSRPGTLPANLQGIWNDQIVPPWDSKYTVNINTEMNYWPVEVSGLPELHEPLFEMLDRVAEEGTRTAREMYGARGYCLHHNTDIWADTMPQGEYLPATFWPLAHLWLVTHLWDHYLFTGDLEFLADRYPLLRGASEFSLDYLVEDSGGRLITSPSVSPENSYILEDGAAVSMCEGPAMDSQMIRSVLQSTITAEELLGIEDGVAEQCRNALQRIPEEAIGPDGRLLEGARPDVEADPGHRHLSHLWALFPGLLIDPVRHPKAAEAARRSLAYRIRHGGGRTGWSRAWVVNLFAALGDGEAAHRHLDLLLALSTYPNLLDVHPPFQIDGNLGGAAGVAEMLLRSRWDGRSPAEIRVLPALPAAWPSGSFRGLRARGGFVVSAGWNEKGVSSLDISAPRGGHCRVEGPGIRKRCEIKPGETLSVHR